MNIHIYNYMYMYFPWPFFEKWVKTKQYEDKSMNIFFLVKFFKIFEVVSDLIPSTLKTEYTHCEIYYEVSSQHSYTLLMFAYTCLRRPP